MFAASSMRKTSSLTTQIINPFFVNRRRAPLIKNQSKRGLRSNLIPLIMALNLEKVLNLALLDVSANVAMSPGTAIPSLGIDSPQVIRVDQSTVFTFTWTTAGFLLPWFNASQLKFDVFYELMGAGESNILVPTTTTTTLGLLNTTTLTLAANAVPEGVYRIVVRMMLLTPTGTTPTPICGFEELDLVEYYPV
jgi:hypothetical protein